VNDRFGFIDRRPSAIATTGSYAKYTGPSAILPRKHPACTSTPAESRRLLRDQENLCSRPRAYV